MKQLIVAVILVIVILRLLIFQKLDNRKGKVVIYKCFVLCVDLCFLKRNMNFDKKETLALYVKNYSGVFDIMSSTVIILVIVMLTIADISFSFYILEILCLLYRLSHSNNKWEYCFPYSKEGKPCLKS